MKTAVCGKNPRKRAFGVHKPTAVPNAGDSQAQLISNLLVILTTAWIQSSSSRVHSHFEILLGFEAEFT